MPRFYISDGARPGRRSPADEYATRVDGVGSDILNEAQAIARGRKLTPTQGGPPPTESVRFIELRFPGRSSYTVVERCAFFRGGIGVEQVPYNLHDEAATTASATYSNWSAVNAIDHAGNSTGGWQSTSGVPNPWIRFAFTENLPISHLRIRRNTLFDENRYTFVEVYGGATVGTLHFLGSAIPDPSGAIDITLDASGGRLLVPTAFGTSGNYNAAYDVNGTNPDAGAYRVAQLANGASAIEADQWLTSRQGGAVPHWGGFDFGTAKQLQRYRIRHYAHYVTLNIVPTRWRIEGSNAGWTGPWTILDDMSASAHVWTAPYWYDGAISGSFRYVRLYIVPQALPSDSFGVAELTVTGI